MRHRAWSVSGAAVLCAILLAGADWPCFRGPNGEGTADDKGLPLTWSETENVAWKTALPGAGSSSPVTAGDKVFVTCYSGYGLDQSKPGDPAKLQYHTVCASLTDGRILWDKTVPAKPPQPVYHSFIVMHGYASASAVTDGKAVYTFFGTSGVFAYDLAGAQLWHAEVGNGTFFWGTGASPILYKNLLIVNASVESQSLIAFDKATGHEVWRARKVDQSWSTPTIVTLPDGHDELVLSLKGLAWGLDPTTGKELWRCHAVDDYVCPAVIAHAGIVYVTGGRSPVIVAIRAGGHGDVTESHVLWRKSKTPMVATPLYQQGRLYWVSQQGQATCLNAETGEVVYEKRLKMSGLDSEKAYASLVAADGKFYAVTRHSGTLVLAPGDEFKELSHNDLGDKSLFNATPAIVGGRLLLRSDQFLYCLGKLK